MIRVFMSFAARFCSNLKPNLRPNRGAQSSRFVPAKLSQPKFDVTPDSNLELLRNL